MASGVNVKMGVTGVAQFKQNMNQAKQTVKTLDAQLALTEKQFKASGDSQDYMAKKTAELQAKLEAQKTVVENAEKALESMASNGVEKSSTAYQKLYQEMLSAKGAMIDTQTQMENIGTAGEDAASGVADANSQLEQIGKGISYQNVTEGLNSITSGLGSIIKKAWQAGEALVRATLGAGSWADELSATALKYSTGDWVIDEETLQRMRKTATIIDTDVESIIAARQKLMKGKGGEDKEVWSFLHDNNIATEGRKTEDIFWDVGDAIMNMTDSAEQEAVAQKVLGRSWAELKPLFTAGRKEYEEMNASWNVVSKESIDSLTEMDDEYQKLSAEFETFKMELLSAFSGPLTEGMSTIKDLFVEFNKYLQTEEGKEKLAQIGDTISGLISGLTQIDPAEVVAGLQGVIDKISGALKWITNNQSLVISAMGAIVAGWAMLKITGGVLDILKIVNAITGLTTAGEAATAGATAGSSWAGAFATAAMKAAPFLAFLYTLLNPASTANNDLDQLWDENGNPTQAALDAGITMTKAEADASNEVYEPDWIKREEIQNKSKTENTGAGTLLKNQQALEEAAKEANEPEELDWRPSYMKGTPNNFYNPNFPTLAAAEKMEEVADGTIIEPKVTGQGDSSGNQSWMSKAIKQAMSGMKVVMDGEKVGELVADTVSEIIAGQVEQ